jgi:hypothetical protein
MKRTLAALVFPALLLPAFATADDATQPCNAWEVEYALAAQFQLSDTMMGAGDGVHSIGPGKLVLHFDNVNGAPAGNVKVVSYEMTDQFTVDAKVMGVGAHIVNDTRTQATPNVCGVSAQGTLSDRIVRWSGVWNGIHTDGHVTCTGSMCGRFNGPPSGQSDVHTPAHPAAFKQFEYAQDMKTFHMDYSVTAKSASPSQTSKVTFNGRETRRACIYVKPCP